MREDLAMASSDARFAEEGGLGTVAGSVRGRSGQAMLGGVGGRGGDPAARAKFDR